LPGLIAKRVLTEKLRPEIQHIRISPDGKYVLAQDDSNVFLLQREPLKSLGHFPAHDAEPAQFSSDSRSIALLFGRVGSSPRVESWDVATQKLVQAHEVYVRDGCLLSRLSPDARTLGCLTLDPNTAAGIVKFDLDLYDVAANSSFFHKKGFV